MSRWVVKQIFVMNRLDKFVQFKIKSDALASIKGGDQVYISCGSDTCWCDCHPAHDGSGNTHCIYIGRTSGQMA